MPNNIIEALHIIKILTLATYACYICLYVVTGARFCDTTIPGTEPGVSPA